MSLLVLQHIKCEGPGYIADFAASRGLELEVIRVFDGTPIPEPQDAQAMIVLGGPMNVYEEERYPWLVAENTAIQAAIAEDMPYLGICLGSQLLAKALGASIVRNPVEEIGFGDVTLAPGAMQDPLFQEFSNVLPAFHWHEDTWELPDGSTLLASSAACPHQAFRYGRAYGLQFHVETTPEMVSDWIGEYSGQLRNFGMWGSADSMRAEANDRADAFRRQTLKLMANFWDLVVLQQGASVR
jgi:GMP synthase-like glutamine amidotransferase